MSSPSKTPPRHSEKSPENTENISGESNDLISLQSQLEELEEKISAYHGVSVESVDSYLDLIHQYNEIKDTGQALIGHLARLLGVSTKQIYTEHFPEIEDIGSA